jgi:hypothetical protein
MSSSSNVSSNSNNSYGSIHRHKGTPSKQHESSIVLIEEVAIVRAQPTVKRTPMLSETHQKSLEKHSKNNLSLRVLKEFKTRFPDAQILVAQPGNVVFTHTLAKNTIDFKPKPMLVNGLPYNHPMVANALYGYEIRHRRSNSVDDDNGNNNGASKNTKKCKPERFVLNFYEVMLPEMDGYGTQPSATEAYTRALHDHGLVLQGDRYHWKSMSPKTFAIHHVGYDIEPDDFVARTVDALETYVHQYKRNEQYYASLQCNNKALALPNANDLYNEEDSENDYDLDRDSDPSDNEDDCDLTKLRRKSQRKCKELEVVAEQETKQSAEVLNQWKANFPDASILVHRPNYITVTHTVKGNLINLPQPIVTVQGIPTNSPLVLNALAGYQTKRGVLTNWYEILLPESDGVGEHPSACEVYTRVLNEQGLFVEGDHYHWKSMSPKHYAIHHSATKFSPVEFARRTIIALQNYAKQYHFNEAERKRVREMAM